MFAWTILLYAGSIFSIAVSKEYCTHGQVSQNLTIKCALPDTIDFPADFAVDNSNFFWRRSILTDKEDALIHEITSQHVCSHYETYFTDDLTQKGPKRVCHLKISNLQLADVANYTCFYWLEGKLVNLDTHELMVGRLTNEDSRVDVVEGQAISLSCYEDDEYPAEVRSMKWEHFSQRRGNRIVHFMTSREKFEIKKSTRDDSGVILCYNDREPSSKYRKKYVLNVMYPPTMYVQNSKVQIRRDDSLTLDCMVEANPWPNVTWTYQESGGWINGSSAEFRHHADRYFTRASIRLNRVQRKDYGVYVCTAENLAGKNELKITVEPSSEQTNASNKRTDKRWEGGFEL